MRKEVINTIFESISKGVNIGIGQLYTEDEFYDKTTITFGSKQHINFGSYSYLGLEHDQRLKDAAINAIERYGIQYPSSRTYVSSTPYRELEHLLGRVFQKPVILATTTTLAHVAVMPIVVNEGDVILMDQQVHSSVQFMISHLQLQGVPFHVVRHNNLENIEAKFLELSEKYNRVWYMIDGIYSMYGDTAPMEELYALLNKYKKFNLYVDDAHGMSWSGPNGAGFVLEKTPFHERMVLITSLNKAFAAGGAVAVIPDPELSERARTCGGPFIFAGQLQMSALGAGIACANIHLSPEIYDLQDKLARNIAFCESQLKLHQLPFIEREVGTPIFFVGVGLPRLGYALVQKLIRAGQYINLAIFPAVSATCTGVRFTVTCNHTFSQIETLIGVMAELFEETLTEEQRSIEDIYKAFRKSPIHKPKVEIPFFTAPHEAPEFQLQHEKQIEKIPKAFWNRIMHDRGSYDWDGLQLLEGVFANNEKEHNNWDFHYFILRNAEGKVILATYLTACLNKDDALVPSLISEQIEQKRVNDPYYLCSKTLMMGCPVSIGDHLYIDRSVNDWERGLTFFLEKLTAIYDENNSNVLNLRDISRNSETIQSIIQDQGFMKVDLFDAYRVPLEKIENSTDFLASLRSDHRRFVRKRALERSEEFEVNLLDADDDHHLDAIYQLYLNTKEKHFELNLFDCSKELFKAAMYSSHWEVLALSLRSDLKKEPIAVSINYRTVNNYHFLFAGLDYRFVESHDSYNQLLWQLVLRSIDCGSNQLNLGLTTGQNKRKFGATTDQSLGFVQVKDDFNFKIISSMVNYDSNVKHVNHLRKDPVTTLESHFGVKKMAKVM